LKTRSLSFLSDAVDDLDNAAAFYERQASGLGVKFLDTVGENIERLRETAGIHSVEHGFHRALADRFPFMIYDSLDSELVTIVAVLDCRQSPPTRFEKLEQRKPQ
jgi:plasmid stabilization system protein ParE